MIQTTSYIPWEEFVRLLECLEKSHNYRFKLLAATMTYAGLRIGDALALKWSDVFNKEYLLIQEGKTSKYRRIKLNKDYQEIVIQEYERKSGGSKFLFPKRGGGTPISREYVNRELKKLFDKYEIETKGNISSHMFRKTFGRHVVNKLGFGKGIMMLQKILNHSSSEITMRYLGITNDEIDQVFDSLNLNDSEEKAA